MTKGEIDRLGERIGASKSISAADLDLLQEYRKTFQESISRVFNFVLTASRKIDRQCIVTYRIKRIDTIIEKLHRFQNSPKGEMKLSRMWDIAGCRCILNTSDDGKLYQLLEVIKQEYGTDSKINDHLANPSASGYRSIHIYVKDKETQKPIEIQIRNRWHHNWATLVEIVDLLYGANNKERGAVSKLGRFLLLYSKAELLTEKEFLEMLRTERKMKVFERMSDVLTKNYLNIRRQWLTQRQKGNYFVIIANKKESEIVSYPTFVEAEMAYYDKYQNNRNSNVVLTHLKTPEFEQISMAYSNYVLAMHAFFDDYRVLVSNKIIECLHNGEYYNFFRYFRIYTNNVKCHFRNLSLEVTGIESCLHNPQISRNQINKWKKEITDRLMLWSKETTLFLNRIGMESTASVLKRWMVRNRVKRLAKAINDGQKI